MHLKRWQYWTVIGVIGFILLFSYKILSPIAGIILIIVAILRILDTSYRWLFFLLIAWLFIPFQPVKFICMLVIGLFPSDEYRDTKGSFNPEQETIAREQEIAEQKRRENDFLGM